MVRFLYLAVGLVLWIGTLSTALPTDAQKPFSLVYVTAYRCPSVDNGNVTYESGVPTVTLYDQSAVGKAHAPITPIIRSVVKTEMTVQFYFDVTPGYYEAFISFPGKAVCSSNGPLAVIPGAPRHLFVMPSNGIADWHAELALAGVMPDTDISVRAVLLDRPAKCGDDPRNYVAKQSDGIVDDGVYYANLMAYDRQDHTIALILSGALFSERAILLTEPLGGPSHGRDLVIKSLDYDALWVVLAATPQNRFACIPHF
jgi:hypothetical protein